MAGQSIIFCVSVRCPLQIMQGEWFNAFFNTAFSEALHGSVQGAFLELVVIDTWYQILTGKPFMQFQGAPDGVF